MPLPVARADFDRVYDELILNRRFVETADYYAQSRERYWNALRRFERLGLPPGSRTLDIGGGQFAILATRLLGHRGAAGDVVETAEADVRAAGLDFCKVDLFSDENRVEEPFDCVTLLEVIEHIPQPPYLVFERVRRLLKPGGALFLTTPNGHRFRNVLYMLAGREVLDIYRYPGPGEILGHQHEYTMKQMTWQLKRAGLSPLFAEHYEDGWRGATLWAKIARVLIRPVGLIPHLRNGLVMAARA